MESVARRGRSVSGHLAVALTGVVAVLSIATGIANIGTTAVLGPIAEIVPPAIQQTAGFSGTLTGFVMLISAYGLRRGLRVAWTSAAILLPLTAVQGLIQSSPLSLPLVVLSVVAMPTMVATRDRFDRELSLTTAQIAAGLALVGVMIYGTVGSFALRDRFRGIESLLDAFYFTIVTASTVGYGDVTPTTPTARLFATSIVVVGTASFAVALGALLGPLIQARFAAALGRMNQTNLDLLEEHVIVLGYGELTEQILAELHDEADVVVVVDDPERVSALVSAEYDAITGDPSDEATLDRVGIDTARAVVAATEDDADDALAVLTARQLNPSIRIVAAATNHENVRKLERAGADTVISPTVIGGHLVAESAMGRADGARVAEHIAGQAAGATAESEATDAATEGAGVDDSEADG
jgi:voltage-gated potassium channel